jgi:O-antigen/teichoic acid export membrane protein
MAIRGGALRTGGFVLGTGLVAVSSIFLLRYLGVTNFGRYVTVMSLVAIVGGLSDAGLTIIGQREYVASEASYERQKLVANILGIRLLVTPVGVVLATVFSTAAGYGRTLALGTLLAGTGLVLSNAGKTLTIPLSARLRLAALTATETIYPAVIAVGVVLLVVGGAGLLAFFALQIVAGVAALVLSVTLVGRRYAVLPRVSWREWRPILIEAAPMGVAVIVTVVYLRVLVVMASLLTTGTQTGLFATSYRILEVLLGIPTVMIGAAFPILAHAGASDEPRLAYALQRLVEVSLLVAAFLVLVLAIGAGPIVRILGGPAYEPASTVLRIQCFALLGSFLSTVWTAGLVAVRRQSALITTNAIALVTVLVLGSSLIPSLGAKGAAIAAVVGEAVLALATLAMLVRARPQLRPRFGFSLRVVAAAGAGALCALIPHLPALAVAGLAGVAYCVAAWLTRAVPREVLEAFSALRPRER